MAVTKMKTVIIVFTPSIMNMCANMYKANIFVLFPFLLPYHVTEDILAFSHSILVLLFSIVCNLLNVKEKVKITQKIIFPTCGGFSAFSVVWRIIV